MVLEKHTSGRIGGELSLMDTAKGLWARNNKDQVDRPPIGPLVSLKGHFDQSKDSNLLILSTLISQRYAIVSGVFGNSRYAVWES